MNIKVLEMSCCSGGKLQAITEETIKELGINVNIEIIGDMQKMMALGVMRTPAHIIDDEVGNVYMGLNYKDDYITVVLKKVVENKLDEYQSVFSGKC